MFKNHEIAGKSAQRKAAGVFLTLCSVAFNSARLTWELEKKPTSSSLVNTLLEWMRRNARALVLRSDGTNLSLLRAVFDFLKSGGSPRSPVTTTAEPLILSPLIVFQYRGGGGIQTIAPTAINEKLVGLFGCSHRLIQIGRAHV